MRKTKTPMSKPTQLPFTLNEPQIVAAVVAALMGVDERKLSVSFTNSRPPKGLSAALSVDENFIREAVIGHARKLVNPTFTHFSVDFVHTRGEDGQTASIIASTHPIARSEPEQPTTTAKAGPTPEVPAEEPASQEATAPLADAGEGATEAPWEDDGKATSAEATTSTEADEAATADSEAAVNTAAPAPATGRSRLFAELSRSSIKDSNAADAE
jgi:hypothetical protein